MNRKLTYFLCIVLAGNFLVSAWAADRGAITSGQTVSYSIDGAGISDSYQFYGHAGDGVVITANASSGYLDPVIYLYTASGTLEAHTA